METLEKDVTAAEIPNYTATTDSTGRPTGPEQKKQPEPDNKTKPAPLPDLDKKIIKQASLRLEVKDCDSYYLQLRDKIRQVGGYVSQEQQTETAYGKEYSVLVKVPVEQFDQALVLFVQQVEKTKERTVSSQDVTTEFIDTRSRMESKKQVRLRYLDLLKQAKNMEEILQVQGYINAVQEEIDAAAGRLQYLGHSAAFSTINLTYFKENGPDETEQARTSFGNRLFQSFKTGGTWISELLIAVVALWPLILLSVAGMLVYRKWQRNKKQ